MLYRSCVSSRWLAVAAIAIAVFGFQGVVYATPISVTNPSFDTDVLSDGAYTTAVVGSGTQSGWSYSCAGISGYDQLQIWNPAGSGTYYYSGAGGSNSPAGGAGANVAEISQAAGESVPAYLYQDLSTTLMAGQTYTLTIACGYDALYGNTSRNTNGWPEDGILGISTSSMSLGTYLKQTDVKYDNLIGSRDSFVDVVASFTATSSHAGENLRIYMATTGKYNGSPTPGWGWIDFDNVRLDATPEPGTLTLLATGLVGLVCYAWRKRK